jgi:hypothetical protein
MRKLIFAGALCALVSPAAAEPSAECEKLVDDAMLALATFLRQARLFDSMHPELSPVLDSLDPEQVATFVEADPILGPLWRQVRQESTKAIARCPEHDDAYSRFRAAIARLGEAEPPIIIIPPADLPTAECEEIATKAAEYRDRLAAAELAQALGYYADLERLVEEGKRLRNVDHPVVALRKRYTERLAAFDERCR